MRKENHDTYVYPFLIVIKISGKCRNGDENYVFFLKFYL